MMWGNCAIILSASTEGQIWTRDIMAKLLENVLMIPKNNREVTAEEMLEQCRRNRQEARILENRDRPYEIKPALPASRISVSVSIPSKSKAS